MKKFALISHVLPPSPTGQAAMLYRILSGVEPQSYLLIHSRAEMAVKGCENNPCSLEAKYYCLPLEPTIYHFNFFPFSIFRNIFNIVSYVSCRTRNIVKIIRKEPETAAIIACTGEIADIPAGYFASKIMGLPFYAYLFDDYVNQWTGVQRIFARCIAALIFKHCAGVIGPNEFICEEYKKRYQVSTTLVRNPINIDELTNETKFTWPDESEKIKVVYTGSIYHANFDCFINLIQAIHNLPQYPIELHIFTSQTPQEIQIHGIKGDNVYIHHHLPYQEIIMCQHRADILFLPLSFTSSIPEVIRTSAPGKMGEYLNSGRPVLAHVPGNSFVAYFFTNHKCGWLADHNDAGNLAAVIQQIITQPENRKLLTQSARKIARDEFSPELAREQLVNRLLGETQRE